MDKEARKALTEEWGQKLRATRESRGLSQVELQKRTGLNAWRLESGQIDPSLSSLYRLARALNVSVEELVKEEG